MAPEPRDYIGDGVYISFDGFHIWLHTERQLGEWEEIALEPNVFIAMCLFAKKHSPVFANIISQMARAEGGQGD